MPVDPAIGIATASALVSYSVDGFRKVLNRHDSWSYGKREHKKANESFQEVLRYLIALLQILKKQQEDEAYIDEATLQVAQAKREEIQQLLGALEKQAGESKAESKWYTRFRSTDRNRGFYGDDLEHLRLLDDGLETLIENLQSARKKKLSMRQDIDRLVQTQELTALQLKQAPSHFGDVSLQISQNEVLLAKKTFRQLKVPFLPYWKRHEQYSRERLHNTCGWIRETEAYQQWTGASGNWSNQHKLLWLDGAAGSGKSILASYVVDTRRDQGKCVAYSYFANGLVQTVPEVVVSILTQLWTAAVPDNDATKDQSDNVAMEKFDQWTHSCFRTFSKEFTPKPIIVFDGWDEERMDDPPRFEKFLLVLLNLGYYVLVTSRSKPKLSTFSDQIQGFYNLPLPTEAQRVDLKMFSEQVIADHHNSPAYSIVNESKDKIFEWIIDDQSIKSFHTVRLYLESALRQTSEAEVHSILKETNPVRLIFQDHAGYPARQISEASLLWLSQTKRPMKIDALREALALLESNPAQNGEGDFGTSSTLFGKTPHALPEADQLPTTAFVQSCGMNLLRVDEASDTVALNQNLFTLHVPSPQSQTVSVLADMCISVLSIEELDTFDYKDMDVIRDYTSKHQFLCHAASTFHLHIEDEEVSEDMRPTLVQLLGDRHRLWKVIAIREWCKQNFEDVVVSVWQSHVKKIEQTTAIQVAIECGDWKTLKELLDLLLQRPDTNTRDHKSALNRAELESWCFLAFNRDRRSICFDLLYETLLDLNLQERSPQSPIGAASNYDLSLVSSRQGKAFSEAWTKVHKWFDKRHDITGYETDFTKLSSRARSHDLLALRSAWSRAWDPKLQGAIVACTLQAIVQTKDNEMLEKLLHCGFRPSQRLTAAERRDHSPLHAAARTGSLKMLKTLLDHGADVNVVNAAGETVLFPAIDYAHEHNSSRNSILLIRTLLTSGVEVNTPRKNKDAPTALEFAIAKESVAVVELLLRHGARYLDNQTGPFPSRQPTHSSSELSRIPTNESYSSSGDEIRGMLEKRQRTLARLQRSRAKRMSAS